MCAIRPFLLGTLPLFLALTFPVLSLSASAQDHEGHKPGDSHKDESQSKPAVPEFRGDPYMLDSDPVSDKPLGPIKNQVIIQHEGRELRFSSKANADTFKVSPAKFLAALDKKMIEQQKPFYPMETCVVSTEKLGGDMGEPVDFIYKNRLVRFCCDGCKPKFLKGPDKYIATLDQALIAKQLPHYPLKTCVVSGEKLGGMGKPIDRVYGNRLVRFCCKDCPQKFEQDPVKYVEPLASYGKEKHKQDGHKDHDHKDKDHKDDDK